jgi:hypothetical protein
MRRITIHLAALLALATLVQSWSISRAVTPALDAVRYAAFAQRIEREGLLEAVRRESEHPLFPAVVVAAHRMMSWSAPGAPDLWARAVQWGAAAPLVLAVVPVYLLLLRAFGVRVAALGGLFFCVLPRVARLGADGTSDSLALLLCAMALWCCVEYLVSRDASRGLRRRSAVARNLVWLITAGVATGLSLLARAEGLLLIAAVGVLALADQCRAVTRQAWTGWLAGAACLIFGLAAVWLPVWGLVGATTPRAALARVLGRGDGPRQTTAQNQPKAPRGGPSYSHSQVWMLPDGTQASFPTKESSVSSKFFGLPAAIGRYGREATATLHYWFAALAAWGAWTAMRRPWSSAERLLAVLFVVVSLGTIAMASRAGYLTTRHLLLLALCAVGPAAGGALELGRRIQGLIVGRWRVAWSPAAFRPDLSALLAVVTAVAALPATLLPVHPTRAGHRQAARWLTETAAPGDVVLDTRGLTGMYTGRTTRRYDAARETFADPRLEFIVVEASELRFDSDRARTLRGMLATAARPVARFDGAGFDGNWFNVARGDSRNTVLVYRWRPDDFARRIASTSLAEAR